MVFSVKKIAASKSSSADVVEGHLVLSLLNAQDPKIWRMALDKIGTASFEIKSTKDTQETNLILKPTKGTAEIIATFETKDEAIEALSQASEALRGGVSSSKKKILSTPAKQSALPPTEKSQWGIVLLGILIVIGLYYVMQGLIPQEGSFPQEDGATTATQTNTPPQQKTGVPVSADDFLSAQ